MKYYNVSRFMLLITGVIILAGYHVIEYYHGPEPTREERGYYGQQR